MSQTNNLSVIAAGRDANDDAEDFARAGTFHAQKNCDQYSGLAGGFCTLTVSTLKQIPVGTKVVYASAATATALSSDLMLVSALRRNPEHPTVAEIGTAPEKHDCLSSL